MITLARDKSAALWDKYWDEIGQELFKLEVLQDSTPEDDGPSLRSWYRGDKEKSIEFLEQEDITAWIKDCRQTASNGVELVRLYIVDRPYSQYLEWVIENYKRIHPKTRRTSIFA